MLPLADAVDIEAGWAESGWEADVGGGPAIEAGRLLKGDLPDPPMLRTTRLPLDEMPPSLGDITGGNS